MNYFSAKTTHFYYVFLHFLFSANLIPTLGIWFCVNILHHFIALRRTTCSPFFFVSLILWKKDEEVTKNCFILYNLIAPVLNYTSIIYAACELQINTLILPVCKTIYDDSLLCL